MNDKILVTDSLFIFDEHIKKLNGAGFEVERLDKPSATEDELVSALEGKVGYIVGGIERVTEPLLKRVDGLKVIGVTATAWQSFVPGAEIAKSKGIMIANTPHANASAVAEWTFSASLAMVRNLFTLGRTGKDTFKTSPGFGDLKVGIVGLGSIGEHLAQLYKDINVKSVKYWSHTQKQTDFDYQEIDELLSSSDIICFCVSVDAGADFVNAEKLSKVKAGAIVTVLSDASLNEEALYKELASGRLRAFLDWTPKDVRWKDLSLETFYCSNESAAYNTHFANKVASDWITESMINLLKTGEDQHRVL